MTTSGNKQSQGYHTLFLKPSTSGGMTTLLVYVDGIILTRNDWKEQQLLSQCLANEVEIKRLWRLKYSLRIEVDHPKRGIFISQQNKSQICSRKQVRQLVNP